MSDGSGMDEDAEYEYEYEDEDNVEEDEQLTDGDFDEYDYDKDTKEYSNDGTTKAKEKAAADYIVPDGSYVLKDYSEICPMMDSLEMNVSSLLHVDKACAEILLQKLRWNCERLTDYFFADSDKVSLDAGVDLYVSEIITDRLQRLLSAANEAMGAFKVRDFLCRICGDEFSHSEGFAMGCNHWFCGTCYREYLKSQVNDGPSCITATCPEYKCCQAITSSVFEAMLDGEFLAKYKMYLTRNFIDSSKNMKYCPSPDCNKVAIGSGVTRIYCTCNKPFCFRCGEEAHDPCNCVQLGVWHTKCQDESETANWILANTKKCPQCRTRIEKNQGCNHMNCKICKYEFCWICNGSWDQHNQATGGYYKCNRYEATTTDNTKSAADKAKAELDKYLHYYQRYHAHDVSLKFASQQRELAERKMVEQQEAFKTSWIDVQFLKQAVELVIECRRVLKYTYALGFFLQDDASKQLFEYHQEMLEINTETLHEYTEASLEKLDRSSIVNLTRVTEKFLEHLLASAANDFAVADGTKSPVEASKKNDKTAATAKKESSSSTTSNNAATSTAKSQRKTSSKLR